MAKATILGVDSQGEAHIRVDFDGTDDRGKSYHRDALKVVPGSKRYTYKGMYQERSTGQWYGYFIVKGGGNA